MCLGFGVVWIDCMGICWVMDVVLSCIVIINVIVLVRVV